MKFQVRRGLFETNSSSTHSLCMCLSSDFDRWKSGEMVFNRNRDKLVPIDDKDYVESKEYYINNFGEEKGLEYLRDDYFSFDDYSDHMSYKYNTFKEEFTTPSGEKVISFGYYGNDY